MTISTLLSNVGELNPHQYDTDRLIDWVSEVDRELCRYVDEFGWYTIEFNQDAEATFRSNYYKHADSTEETLLDDEELYTPYLQYKIAYFNEEYDRAATHYSNYQNILNKFKSKFIQHHRPPRGGRFKVIR